MFGKRSTRAMTDGQSYVARWHEGKKLPLNKFKTSMVSLGSLVLILTGWSVIPQKNCLNEFVCELANNWRQFQDRGLTPVNDIDVTALVSLEISQDGTDALVAQFARAGARSHRTYDKSCDCEVLTLKVPLRVHSFAWVELASEDLVVEFHSAQAPEVPVLRRAYLTMTTI